MLTLRMMRALRRPASLLALAALAVQLAAASIVLPSAPPAAALDRLIAASICHDRKAHDDGGAPARHHMPACDVCALCQALAHAGTLLVARGFTLAPPALPTARAVLPPPARAPPGRTLAGNYPRGPPPLA